MQLLEVASRFEDQLTILVKVESSNLEIKDDLLLGASADLDEGAPEVGEDLLDK